VCKHVIKAQHKAFDSLVMLVSRSLWLSRNACVFRSWQLATGVVVQSVVDQVMQWCMAGLIDQSSPVQV
jgi:hypothetical protein